MAKYELKLPQMGESVAEATITAWLKKVGDTIDADESIVEVATDKVDSEVPSEVSGTLIEIRFQAEDVVKIGEVMAIIETEDTVEKTSYNEEIPSNEAETINDATENIDETTEAVATTLENEIAENPFITKVQNDFDNISPELDKFYSPLVKSIAKKEGITLHELNKIMGSGLDGRVTKEDILLYAEIKKPNTPIEKETAINPPIEEKPVEMIREEKSEVTVTPQQPVAENVTITETPQEAAMTPKGDEVIEMSRMGKLIAQHMTESKHTSAHVQSFTEVDMTRIWNWRNKVKKAFEEREGEKFTFTPIFMEVVTRAIEDYPMINISVDGTKIIKKKNINIGMATALPDGNLIVPVIKNADQLSLRGMAKVVNDLANRARTNQLKPDEVKDGTYTVTNIGSFGNVFGTPIINQPQVGILAIGAIRKVPAVVETPDGDTIGIRYKMMLSHSYDHRVVNGALGGMFVQRVAEYLESWDTDRDV